VVNVGNGLKPFPTASRDTTHTDGAARYERREKRGFSFIRDCDRKRRKRIV